MGFIQQPKQLVLAVFLILAFIFVSIHFCVSKLQSEITATINPKSLVLHEDLTNIFKPSQIFTKDRGAGLTGYNMGDSLNIPSFWAGWPIHLNISSPVGWSSSVKHTVKTFPDSIVGIYYRHDNGLSEVPTPFVPQLKAAVRIYGLNMNHTERDRIIREVSKADALLVHIRSCDKGIITSSFLSDISHASKLFGSVLLMGQCHHDERYVNVELSIKAMITSMRLIFRSLRKAGIHPLIFHSESPDDALFAMAHATNLLVHTGGFSAVGALVNEGNVYFGHQISNFVLNPDFFYQIKNPRPLYDMLRSPYADWFDWLRFHSSRCIFNSFDKGDGKMRFCTNAVRDKDCWVLSVASNGNYSLGKDILDKTNCEVHGFYCTGNFSMSKNVSSRVHTHKYCSKNQNPTQNSLTYGEFLRVADKSTPPFIMIIDIDGSEYDALRSLILDSDSRLLPTQIVTVFHIESLLSAGDMFTYNSSSRLWQLSRKKLIDFVYIIDQSSYRLISRVDNYRFPGCIQVVLMRDRYSLV